MLLLIVQWFIQFVIITWFYGHIGIEGEKNEMESKLILRVYQVYQNSLWTLYLTSIVWSYPFPSICKFLLLRLLNPPRTESNTCSKFFVSFLVDAIPTTLGTGNIPFACCNTPTTSRSREVFKEGDTFMAATIFISLVCEVLYVLMNWDAANRQLFWFFF